MLSTVGVVPVSADPQTILSVEPTTSSSGLGTTFNVTVTVTDVTDVMAWGFYLGWTSGLLNCTEVYAGDFCTAAFTRMIDNDGGHVIVGGGDFSGLTGSGRLAIVEFLVLDVGETVLDVYNDELRDSGGDLISHETDDGYFDNRSIEVPTSIEIVFQDTGTSELIGPPPDVCQNVIVTLHITNISSLWSWKVTVTWDPVVLSYVSADEGAFLETAGNTVFLVATPTSGEIPEMSCTLLEEVGASGTGDLAYITFHIEARGETYIELPVVDFVDPDEETLEIDTVTPGHLSILLPPPTPPNAEFTPLTSTFIYVYENVTLDAGTSTDGWDTLPNLGHACPIVDYIWEIDFGCNGTIELTLEGEYIEDAFQCEEPGDVRINLTIYAPDPTLPTHPDYVEYDSEVHIIHQRAPIVGSAIDVYTEKGGEGPGLDEEGNSYPYPTGWSDAFGPQEEVTVYAYVTYNNEPVEYQPVAFEIKDPTNETRVTRTAFTNASGIATTEFRIPWQGSNAEAMFGDWEIWGVVDVAGNVTEDLCQFRFGYVVSIRDVIVETPRPEGVKKCESLAVTVDIKNIAFTSKNAFLAIILYDECGVPIGMAKGSITVDPENGLTSEYTIHIPTWAFVGTGSVYVNIFTKQPIDGGTPTCPEGKATFTILNTR